jgi:hypothetical protein
VTDLVAIVEPTVTWVHSMYTKGVQALMAESKYRGAKERNGRREDVFLAGVQSNEESLSSAVLGIKGQIDLIARAKLVAVPEGAAQGSSSAAMADLLRQVAESSLPVEIKTGKWRASTAIGHRAQVPSFSTQICKEFIAELGLWLAIFLELGHALCADDGGARTRRCCSVGHGNTAVGRLTPRYSSLTAMCVYV